MTFEERKRVICTLTEAIKTLELDAESYGYKEDPELIEIVSCVKALRDMEDERNISVLVKLAVEEEGQRLLEENERLQADSNFVVPESLDRRILEMIYGQDYQLENRNKA